MSGRTLARPTFVPYITLRHGELPAPVATLRAGPSPHGPRLYYTDEGLRDRDERDVLWARCSQNVRGQGIFGAPRWRKVHPWRQRECMERLLCQGCSQPASKTSVGYLFFAVPPRGATSFEWIEGYRTAQPPLCLKHAAIAAEQCGHILKRGGVALRVRVPRLYGVIGAYYRSRGDRVVPELIRTDKDGDDESALSYRERRLTPWILASQLVRELRGVTVINLAEEIAARV